MSKVAGDGMKALRAEIDLEAIATLIERTARWVAPETFRLLPVWFPEHGRVRGLGDPSDYQVSILEVAGSAATVEAILSMETLWKRKLQSREMG